MKSKEEILQEFLTNNQCWSLNNDSYWAESGIDNILAAMEYYAKQKLKQHGVMQAEASDGAEGAAVGNSAAGKGVSVGQCNHVWKLIFGTGYMQCMNCNKIK
jgi:hypothetical protein